MKFTYDDDTFIPRVPKNLTPKEQLILFLNEFSAKKNEIDKFLDKFVKFLYLEKMGTDEIESMDLHQIADDLKLGLGSIDQVVEDVESLRIRLQNERSQTDCLHEHIDPENGHCEHCGDDCR